MDIIYESYHIFHHFLFRALSLRFSLVSHGEKRDRAEVLIYDH